ncbi:MAG: phosphoglycerate dehydrogenase [Acidobacteriota bacterium]|nr:phosphoglycerate dehydrogenase [Acidobacteriota bacterium]
MKILVADNISKHAVEILHEQESWDVVFLPKKAGAKVAEEIRDADALIVRSATKVTPELLAGAERLRVIGRAGVGVDNVNLDAATQKGVVVMNTPGGNAVSVAEHTMALLLAMARRVPQADALMKQGRWEKKKLEGMELRGKVLGLIGLGQIGSDVARLAKAFEMQIVAYDPYVSSLQAGELDVKLASLEEVLKSSDFISLHASATPETRHLINARTLALAQPGLRIVNCARGELINEADLLSALESGLVAGAALDVFETEPPTNSKLIGHPNVIATPHIAGSTEEAQEIVGIRIVEQVRDFLLTGVARSAVNLPSVSPEEFKKLEPYIQLGEKLGAFLAQLAGERIREVRISYDGGLAELNTHLVRNAVLKGILTPALSQQVNLINAGALAQKRGVEVVEQRSARRATFSNSLGIGIYTEGESATGVGMVGVRGVLRILGLNDIDIEAPLRGVIICIRNQDVPGVIGRVGTILGDRKINIATFTLGRDPRVQQAIALVNVDNHVPDEVLQEIRAIPAVRTARVVEV